MSGEPQLWDGPSDGDRRVKTGNWVGQSTKAQGAYQRARQRAHRRLAAEHSERFEVLLEEEKKREGIRTLKPR